MCPGWWLGRGCLLGVLLLLPLLVAGGASAPAPSTTPGAPGASPYRLHPPPRHRQHSAGGAPRVRHRPRRPRPLSDLGSGSSAPPPTPALTPLVPRPTGPPGITASDPSLMVRNTRSTPSNNTRNFRHHHKYRQQLYSENSGRVMKLVTDGSVLFTDNVSDPHTLLYVRPIRQGVIEMRSEATGLYLCMNKRGKLYTSCNRSSECKFVSQLEDTYYDTLQSHCFSGRYLAIATSGRIKRARRVQGHLRKEHFFLFRRTQLQEAQHIIKRYHEQLVGQPPQRCAGYNEYNLTSTGSTNGGGRRGTGAVTLAPPEVTVVVPVITSSTSTTTPTTPTSRRCRIVKGRKRCQRCRIVKGRKKCRKRQKRCKNKKCRKKRRRKDRRKQGKKRGNQGVNTTASLDVEKQGKNKVVATATPSTEVRGRSKVVVARSGSRVRKGKQRHRHRTGSQQTQRTEYRSVTVTSQARRMKQHMAVPSLQPTAIRKPSRRTFRAPRGSLRPRLRTGRPHPPQPFLSSPSSAHPHRVRHTYSARRGRRPRGYHNPSTSTDA
ncbi:uncharacterized protein [Panulirus ornatus]|uniref:uncharacterized protein n=1 Tax=Panulirus ornatus TaxID=150431 RepID=UPI003A873138